MNKYLNLIEKNKENLLTREEFMPVWGEFKADLNKGIIRVASQNKDGSWTVNKWVKEVILLGFKFGKLIKFEQGYIDKDTLGERKISLDEMVRTVSPTTSVRDGVYIAPKVTFMPPCYTNIGAYIDEGSMVDSLALVGSCAQIGKNVHVGGGAIIGGVLEPVGAYPVIIEDDVFVGAGAVITEGTIVKKGAIIGAGVTITGSTPVYDNVNGKIITANENGLVIIPEGAVVIPGSRKIKSNFDGAEISISTPVIIKYGSKVVLEDLLRP